MSDETLHLSQRSERPDLNELDIKHSETRSLLGAEWTVAVIGSSHYLGSSELGYHELCSCEPVGGPSVVDVPLTVGTDRRFETDAGAATATTTVEGRPLSAFPGPDTADVAYRFGPDAYTTVDLSGRGYETYHTYPEYDLALRTTTTITTTISHERRVQR
jgi:hypothetical protein